MSGLFMINTGDGKGKTTAALGLAMRAVGQGLRVRMIQFLKGKWHYGEMETAKLLPRFELLPMGLGFTWEKTHTPDEHKQAMRRAWDLARESIYSGDYDLVILDELNNVFNIRDFAVDDVLTVGEVVEALRGRPPRVHVLITGRGAPGAFVEAADLVTEMRDVKHPYDEGRQATRGIEF